MSGSYDDVSSSSDADDVPAHAPDAEAPGAETDSASTAGAAAATEETVIVKRRKTRKVGAVLLCKCLYLLRCSSLSDPLSPGLPQHFS